MRALRPLALYSLACLGSSSPSPRSFPTLRRCVRTSYACSCACGLTCGLRVRRQTFRYCLTLRAHALLHLGICRAARCPLLGLSGQRKRSLIWLTGLDAEIQFDSHCRGEGAYFTRTAGYERTLAPRDLSVCPVRACFARASVE